MVNLAHANDRANLRITRGRRRSSQTFHRHQTMLSFEWGWLGLQMGDRRGHEVKCMEGTPTGGGVTAAWLQSTLHNIIPLWRRRDGRREGQMNRNWKRGATTMQGWKAVLTLVRITLIYVTTWSDWKEIWKEIYKYWKQEDISETMSEMKDFVFFFSFFLHVKCIRIWAKLIKSVLHTDCNAFKLKDSTGQFNQEGSSSHGWCLQT